MSTQQQFLQFQLQANLMAAIEIDLVTELVNIPSDRIVPMPHLPPAVMGVYNWRGEILWIVDLSKLLGAKQAVRRDRSLQPTIILTSGEITEDRQPKIVGLVVDEIAEIEWLNLDLIQSPVPIDIYPEFAKWASGVWLLAASENCLKLDGHKIFDCADFSANV
jgi:positive phototaxis protein PixI